MAFSRVRGVQNVNDVGGDTQRVIEGIYSQYGDEVEFKHKQLNKFGRNRAVGNAWETVAEFQSTTANEAFVSTNIIDAIISSSTSDTTQTITIEGHIIDASGNLTFVVQDADLTGQTTALLAMPLARATRAYIKPSGTFDTTPADLVGNVAIYDNTDGDDGSGVPTTPAATKLLLLAGESQTNKAATAISQVDYWALSYFSCAIGDGTGPTNFATVRMETRDIPNGGVWRPLGRDYTLWPDVVGIERNFRPYLVVPKNHDWRVRAKSDAGSCEIYAEAGGFLLTTSRT